MLSYRHGFHAGNAGDVLKHAILIFCLEYLTQKKKPLLCVDTHAGAGLYDLRGGFAAQNREWENGVGRLLDLRGGFPGECVLLRRYLEVCASGAPGAYPGSPLIMSRLLRSADRLVCFELHPADYQACAENLRGKAEVRKADSFAGLKGLLPPLSRRGLVFIDPPYEVKDDYNRVCETLTSALNRFATGTYIIWYPLLRETQPSGSAGFSSRLLELYRGSRCQAELYTSAPEGNRGMYGSGLIIYNPPWTLKAALEESLPVLGSLYDQNRRSGTGGGDIHQYRISCYTVSRDECR
jgi:23S rRNA (adenine2030-N6)-methyltransferase